MRELIQSYTLEKTNKKRTKKKHKLTFKKIKETYGVGNSTILSYVKKFGLNSCFVKKVHINPLRSMDRISFKSTWDKNLMGKLIANRKFLIQSTKNYRSFRHILRYPARGQRTKTNSNTRKKFKSNKLQYLT